MKRLKANGLSLGVLDAFYEPVEIYDATGTTLIGTFTPADPERVKRIYENHIVHGSEGVGPSGSGTGTRPSAQRHY